MGETQAVGDTGVVGTIRCRQCKRMVRVLRTGIGTTFLAEHLNYMKTSPCHESGQVVNWPTDGTWDLPNFGPIGEAEAMATLMTVIASNRRRRPTHRAVEPGATNEH